MAKVYFMKSDNREQVENKQFIAGLNKEDVLEKGKLQSGDFAFVRLQKEFTSPVKLQRLWRVKNIEKNESHWIISFDEVFKFSPFALTDFQRLDIFNLDVSLLNYIEKQMPKCFFELSVQEEKFRKVTADQATFENYIKNTNNLRSFSLDKATAREIDVLFQQNNEGEWYLPEDKEFLTEIKNSFKIDAYKKFGEAPICKAGGKQEKQQLYDYLCGTKTEQPPISDLWNLFCANTDLDKNERTKAKELLEGYDQNLQIDDVFKNEELAKGFIEYLQGCLAKIDKRRVAKYERVIATVEKKMKENNISNETPPAQETKPDNNGNNGGGKPKFPLNQILYGPPGTGKTYNTIDKTIEIIKGEKVSHDEALKLYRNDYKEQIEFVTFHQSYGYEEFIQGIKPSVDKGQVVYNVEDGIFKKFCDKANNDKNNNYVFIIDEINRGNVSKIFGELITLIEESKRIGADEEMRAKLPYKKDGDDEQGFGVPDNVYILGTMNTADRSLVQLDAALRRRFRFIEMMPDYGLLEANAEDGINVQKLLREINKKIRETVDREHQIGHSYLIGVKTKEKLEEVFKNEIIPLLQEYFYEDYENIKVVLGGQEFTNEEQKIDLTNFSFKRIYGEN